MTAECRRSRDTPHSLRRSKPGQVPRDCLNPGGNAEVPLAAVPECITREVRNFQCARPQHASDARACQRFLAVVPGALGVRCADRSRRKVLVLVAEAVAHCRRGEYSNNNGEFVRQGIFTVEGNRLVICWTPIHMPLPRGFQPSVYEQLVVCRREWSQPSEVAPDLTAVGEQVGSTSKLPKAEMPFSPREAAALQQAWAEKVGSQVEVTNSIGMKLRVIPPGSFGDARDGRQAAGAMGSAAGGSGFGGAGTVPPAQVHESGPAVGGPILVGVHEVTVGQFRQFVEDSKYVAELERDVKAGSSNSPSWRSPEIEQTSEQQPVVNVTFNDTLAFCHWLSLKEKKPYRLLTRREWEFCARAGSWPGCGS